MDSKSGFGSAENRECTPLNLACLPRLFGFSAFIFVDFIVRAPNTRPLCDTCVLKELR